MWEGGGQEYIIYAGGWSPSSLEALDEHSEISTVQHR